MNYKFLFNLVISLCMHIVMQAQYGNVWAFGTNAGIDFNSGTPKAIKTSIQTKEGCASICNNQGQLLFYTDGTDVWNRNHQLMPNGKYLAPLVGNITASTSQGSLIVPIPGQESKYYVFSLGMHEATFYFGRLYISTIDMRLDSGLGDVVADHKGKLVDSFLTEHITAVSGNNCDIWVLVLSRANNRFKAYHIDVDGIHPAPIISQGLPEQGLLSFSSISGTLDVSPNRRNIAIAQDKVILYNFDPDSGKVSRPILIDSTNSYGLAFSPDNTKLYYNSEYLCQVDISSGNAKAILDSKANLATYYLYALKRGPDGKIYCSGGADNLLAYNFLSVINQPNLPGSACQFVADGFTLLNGTSRSLGLPNYAAMVNIYREGSTYQDTFFCVDSHLLNAKNPNWDKYIWEDGSHGPTRTVYRSGNYWVRYQHQNAYNNCEEYIDTFSVVFVSPSKDYTSRLYEGMCSEDSFLLEASNHSGSDYTWNDGEQGLQRVIHKQGTYWLTYNSEPCTFHVDTFRVTYPKEDYKVLFDSDSLIFLHTDMQIHNNSDVHFNSFKWTFGNLDSSILSQPDYSYDYAGIYEVRLIGKIDGKCADTVFKSIIVDSPLWNNLVIDRDSICSGESVLFLSSLKSDNISSLYWQLGDGTNMATGQGGIQHAYAQSGIMPVNLTTKFRACPDTSYLDTVYVYPLPEVNLVRDTQLCLNGYPIILFNLKSPAEGKYKKLWNTGATTDSIIAVHPGIYSLSIIQEPLGCRNSASVKISKDCYINIPNTFTPNDDGMNDYFFPRQLLSKNVSLFKMKIYNRWGQVLFETISMEGRGWDGRFNNKEQPSGVYVYQIEVIYDGGRMERYQGNVTLIK